MNHDAIFCDPLTREDRDKWEARIDAMFCKSQERIETLRLLDAAIFHYLTCTENGKEVLHNLTLVQMERLVREAEEPRNVLIVVNPDGWVEVFAHRGVCPRFYTKAPYDGDTDTRKMADDVLEGQLPFSMKSLHFPHATDKGPGRVGACQMIVVDYKQVGNVKGVRRVFTWEACENPWPRSERDENTS